ncbi:MAG: ferrous iron transport protein A [Bacteroidetes bacterium]|nr:ferrous iron transport protein A [Rhodothermia bacterium]MCS7154274.1 ferrous iron transport protein A [Bacteroidota bacterium]MCX7906690.1 ferrous iron transport protein A [Bacteroidota bacterium]MDW8137030.1 FeoA family protein [Bacteroidota bacterium]MDW8285099.1 FeoA family protein [Bacteroidota bacterium]
MRVSHTVLARLRPGMRAVVRRLRPEATVRLLEMGLLEGTEVQVVRFAPLGDPMEIRVRGYLLSIRRREAEAVEVELCT